MNDFLSLLIEDMRVSDRDEQEVVQCQHRLLRWHLYGELPEGCTDGPYPAHCPACGQATRSGYLWESVDVPAVWCANPLCCAGVLWVDTLEAVERETPVLDTLIEGRSNLRGRLEACRQQYRRGLRCQALRKITNILESLDVDPGDIHELVLQVITKRPVAG